MLPWYWVLIALIVGELIGVVVPHFCGMNEQKSKYIK